VTSTRPASCAPTPWCTGKLGNRNNSGWSEAQPYLEHVQRIVDYFKNDVRIAAWDVMNEPDHLSRVRPGCPSNMYDMGWLTGWMQRVINEIRLKDTKHPVTVGLYGYFVNRVVDHHLLSGEAGGHQAWGTGAEGPNEGLPWPPSCSPGDLSLRLQGGLRPSGGAWNVW
jgi:hypothetical protein